MKRSLLFVTLLAGLVGSHQNVRGAIGCTLANPAQDLKYLFPDMTSYREEVRELSQRPDGRELFRALRERLGGDLDPVYETFETPYTLYTVFRGEQRIGIVHGVNVPGRGGVIQIFLSADPETGAIREMFFQRLESPVAKALRRREFRSRFSGLTLADFYKHDYYAVTEPGSARDRVAQIGSPVEDERARPDVEASVRGVRKNLILLDIFVYERRGEPFFLRAQEALAQHKTGGAVPRAAGNATAVGSGARP